MFTRFSEAEKAVHFPPDRRMFIGLKLQVWLESVDSHTAVGKGFDYDLIASS